jgi:hypothetical protein
VQPLDRAHAAIEQHLKLGHPQLDTVAFTTPESRFNGCCAPGGGDHPHPSRIELAQGLRLLLRGRARCDSAGFGSGGWVDRASENSPTEIEMVQQLRRLFDLFLPNRVMQ